MSVKLMSVAFDLEGLSPTQKLVLIVLCDHANDVGGSCHPSAKRVAQKASLSERQCRRVLKELAALGYFDVVGNAAGGGNLTKKLQLNVQKITTPDLFRGDMGDRADKLTGVTPTTDRGDMGDRAGVTPTTVRGDMGDNQTTNNHHITIREPSRYKSLPAICKIPIPDLVDKKMFTDWLEVRKSKRAPLTETAWRQFLKNVGRWGGGDVNDALAICCERGWAGFNPDWLDDGKGNGAQWGDGLVTDYEDEGGVVEVQARVVA